MVNVIKIEFDSIFPLMSSTDDKYIVMSIGLFVDEPFKNRNKLGTMTIWSNDGISSVVFPKMLAYSPKEDKFYNVSQFSVIDDEAIHDTYTTNSGLTMIVANIPDCNIFSASLITKEYHGEKHDEYKKAVNKLIVDSML